MTKLINILLQRNDCNIPWGFEIQERKNAQQSIVITRVLPNAVSTYNIHRGDFILQIQDTSVTKLSDNEIKSLINKPLKELRLIVLQNTKSTIMPSNNFLPTHTASIPIGNCQQSEIILSKSLGNPPTKPPVVRFPKQSVANCVPSKKLTQEPNFNTPFYKPQMPIYKKSNQTSSTPNENQFYEKELQPRKILREFIQNKDGTMNLTERVPISHNTNVRQLERRKSFFESLENENVPNIESRKNSLKTQTLNQKGSISNTDAGGSKPNTESYHEMTNNLPSTNVSNFDPRKNNSITNLVKSNAEMGYEVCYTSSDINYPNLEVTLPKTGVDKNVLNSDFKNTIEKIPEILSKSVSNFDSKLNSSVANRYSNTKRSHEMFESLSSTNIPNLDSRQNKSVAIFKPNTESFQNKCNPNSRENILNSPESIHEMLDVLSNDSSYTVNYSIESIQNLDELQSLENLSTGQIFLPQNYSLSYKNIDKECTAKRTSPFRCFSDNFFNLNNQLKNQIKPNSSRRNRKSKCDVIMTECLSSEDETGSATAETITNLTSEEEISNDDDSLYMYELINENVMYDTKIVSKNVVYDNYVERNYGPDLQIGNFWINEENNVMNSDQNTERENLQNCTGANESVPKTEMRRASNPMNNFHNNEISSNQDNEPKNFQNFTGNNFAMSDKEIRRTSTLDDLQYFDAYNDVRRISNQDDSQYFDAENEENAATVNQNGSEQYKEKENNKNNSQYFDNSNYENQNNNNSHTTLYENNFQNFGRENFDRIETLNQNNLFLHNQNNNISNREKQGNWSQSNANQLDKKNYEDPNDVIRMVNYANKTAWTQKNAHQCDKYNFNDQNNQIMTSFQNDFQHFNHQENPNYEKQIIENQNDATGCGEQNCEERKSLQYFDSKNFDKPNKEVQIVSEQNYFKRQNCDFSNDRTFLEQENSQYVDKREINSGNIKKRDIKTDSNQNNWQPYLDEYSNNYPNNGNKIPNQNNWQCSNQQNYYTANNEMTMSNQNNFQTQEMLYNFTPTSSQKQLPNNKSNLNNPTNSHKSNFTQSNLQYADRGNCDVTNIGKADCYSGHQTSNQNNFQYFETQNCDFPMNQIQSTTNHNNFQQFENIQNSCLSNNELQVTINQNTVQQFDNRQNPGLSNNEIWTTTNKNHFEQFDRQHSDLPNHKIQTTINQNNFHQLDNMHNYGEENNETRMSMNQNQFDNRQNFCLPNNEIQINMNHKNSQKFYNTQDSGLANNEISTMNQNKFQQCDRQNHNLSNITNQPTMYQNNFKDCGRSYNDPQNNEFTTNMNQKSSQNTDITNYSLPSNEISGAPMSLNNQHYFESEKHDLQNNPSSFSQNNLQYFDKSTENIFNQPVFNYSESPMNCSMSGLNKLPSIKENKCINSDIYNVQQQHTFRQQTNSPGNYGNDQPCFPGPPPPPPPPGPCNLPSKRLSTEIPDRRLEPPACVQNAMMTKDKKPFTYTPGGLDLSQIKSPRMARRISRNAQAEGVSEPRQSPLAQPPGQLPPSALAAMQPNLPTPVFPPGGIPPPPPPPSNAGPIQSPPPPPPLNNIQSNVNKPVPPPQNFQRPDIKSIIPPNPTAMLRQTGGPMRRGPYPPEPVDEPISPEKLQSSNNIANKPQLGSLYIPPVKNQEVEENRNTPSNIQSPVRNIHTPPSVQSPVLNKAPTPWLTQRVQPQQQSNVPTWAHREDSEPKSPPTVITKVMPIQNEQSVPKSNNVSSIQIQHRPQVYVVNPPQQQQQHPMSPGPQSQKHSRIIPIQIEGSNSPTQMSPAANISRNDSVNQPQWRSNGNVQRTQEIPNNQFRKLQLQEDDQNLMNRFKNQVDDDTFLHNETDPRYRGAAIPSRAFRMLQTMTDSGSDPIPQYSNAPRNSPGPVVRTIPIQREDDGNVQQQYIPPSEQQAPADPRKYTGSAIPSRSFRMLQAMTSPNNTPCGPDESDL